MKDVKTFVYEELKRQILTLELRPGERLDESAVSAGYAISRTWVREVCLRLEGDGYLDLRAGRLARVMPMDCERLRNLCLAIPIVYPLMNRLAARNHTDEQWQRLLASLSDLRQAVNEGDAVAMMLERHVFSGIIGEMAANPYLQVSYEHLLINQTRIGCAMHERHHEGLKPYFKHTLRQHEALVEALGQRQAEAAASRVLEIWDAMRRHIQHYVIPASMVSNQGVQGQAVRELSLYAR